MANATRKDRLATPVATPVGSDTLNGQFDIDVVLTGVPLQSFLNDDLHCIYIFVLETGKMIVGYLAYEKERFKM